MLEENFPAYSARPGMTGVGVYQLTGEIFKTVSIFQLPASHVRDDTFMKGFKRCLSGAVGSLQRSIMTKAKRVSEG